MSQKRDARHKCTEIENSSIIYFSATWVTLLVILTLEFVYMPAVWPLIWCYSNVYRETLDLLSALVAMVASETHTLLHIPEVSATGRPILLTR